MKRLVFLLLLLPFFMACSHSNNQQYAKAYQYVTDSANLFPEMSREPTFKYASLKSTKWKVVPDGYILHSRITYYNAYGMFVCSDFQCRIYKKANSFRVNFGGISPSYYSDPISDFP